METEEQIYDLLLNKKATAVFVQLYVPGHSKNEEFNKVFEKESARYSSIKDDEVHFMRVHCRKHANFCTNKMWKGRILPAAEAYYVNEQD
jgi:hypothetical protein